MDTPEPPQAVKLAGTPEAIGRLWGAINREAIHADLQEHYLAPAAKAGLHEAELIRRAGKFVSLAEKLAPHWLAEAAAIARAAEVDPDLYLSFVGNVYRSIWSGEECTSYAVASHYTEDGRIFFHKNRDNAAKLQSAFIVDTQVTGVNKFISTSDASALTCMMMVNDKGLAGSADCGGLEVQTPRFRGWMNTAILRHIAETASDCAEALAIIEEFVGQGNYAGGAGTGTHWLFVDRHGAILEVSNNSDRVEHAYHSEKAYLSAERGPVGARLQELPEPVTFADFHNVSRDPATCWSSTVSGMSVEISRAHPDLLTVAWLALPASSLAFPLFMGGEATPLALLNGEVDLAGRESTRGAAEWEAIEGFAFASQRMLEARVEGLLAEGRADEARKALDAWMTQCAQAHRAGL